MSTTTLLPAATYDRISQARVSHHPHIAVLYGTLGLLLFGPLAFGSTDPWAIFVLESGSALLFAGWSIDQIGRGTIHVKNNRIFPPMIAFLTLIAIQLMTGRTVVREATLSAAMLFICYGILSFLLVQSIRRTRHVQRIAPIVSVYGVAMALFAIIQSLSSNGKLYWVIAPRFGGWIYGPYVNHDHFAGLMEMLMPVPLMAVLAQHISQRDRWIAGASAALIGGSILLSGSRGGAMALAAEVLVLTVVIIWQRLPRKAIVLLIAMAVSTLGLFIWLGGPEQYERLTSMFLGNSGLSDQTRFHIAHDAYVMFTQRPVFGWGLGTFPVVDPQVRTFYTDLLVDHAHNDYLQLLAETGLVGLGLALWFLTVAVGSAFRKVRRYQFRINGLIGLCALMGITGILVHSLVDFNLEIPANAAVFYALSTVACLKSRFGMHHCDPESSQTVDG